MTQYLKHQLLAAEQKRKRNSKILSISLLIIVLFFLCRCDSRHQTGKYAMNCTWDIGSTVDIYRCENDEAICYEADHGISCKWKDNSCQYPPKQ